MQLWIQHQSVSRSHRQYVTHDSSSGKRQAHLWTLHNGRGPPRRFTRNSSLCHYIQPFTNTARWRHMMQCPLVFTAGDKLKLYGMDFQRLFSKPNILDIRNASNLTRTCELVRSVFLPGGISAALWTGGPHHVFLRRKTWLHHRKCAEDFLPAITSVEADLMKREKRGPANQPVSNWEAPSIRD